MMIPCPNMTPDEWDALTEGDRIVLRKMNFCRPEEPKEKVGLRKKSHNPLTEIMAAGVKSTAPKPYHVKLNLVCNCCLASVIKVGMMDLPYEKAPYLRFRKYKEDEVIDENPKFIRQEQLICDACNETLMQLDKEVLVQMIIKHHTHDAVTVKGIEKMLDKVTIRDTSKAVDTRDYSLKEAVSE